MTEDGNWKRREVRSWPRQQVKQGQSLDVEAGMLGSFLPPLGPWTVQREGDTCSGGLHLEDGLLRREPTPQKEDVCCRCSALWETGRNGGGGGGKRSQSLFCSGLATLRLPAGAALPLMEERVPLEIQGIQVYHYLVS